MLINGMKYFQFPSFWLLSSDPEGHNIDFSWKFLLGKNIIHVWEDDQYFMESSPPQMLMKNISIWFTPCICISDVTLNSDNVKIVYFLFVFINFHGSISWWRWEGSHRMPREVWRSVFVWMEWLQGIDLDWFQ